MQLTTESIARHLGGASKSGDNWSCRCPAHEDKRASLSIKEESNGKLLVHCHAGCAQADVVAELKARGLWNTPKTVAPPDPLPVQINLGQGKGQVVAEYNYTDEDGQLLYQAVRYEPKDFRQRAPINGSGWTWSIKGVRRVLYRLPEVLAAVAEGQTVYICEGEKDVEAARSLGLVATCNAMGADNGSGNKWLAEFGELLRGANVVVVPDQDDPGIRHAEWVISTLQGKAQSVRVVNPASGKDLADWIKAGATVDDIVNGAVDAFAVQGSSNDNHGKFEFFDVSDLIADIKPIDWLVRDVFEADSLALIYGQPGGGKSFFAVDIACAIATGNPFFERQVKQGPVFYIAGEGHNGLARRFKAWEVSRAVPIVPGTLFKSGGAMAVLDEDSIRSVYEQIARTCDATGQAPAFICIDTLARNFGAGDENSTEDMSVFISHLDKWLRRPFGCCVSTVHHAGHNMERARGSSALKAAVDAECEVSKDDSGLVKIRFTKMKDAEIPADMMLKIRGVELPGVFDEDGNPVTSAVLDVAGDMIHAQLGKRTDGTQITAIEVLKILDQKWHTTRQLEDPLMASKGTVSRVVGGLKRLGFINDQGITQAGLDELSRAGHQILGHGKPVWKRKS
ncbi:Archaeal primase DnaG/twinkle, TOPRIM domain [uncultured Caudovirales phage]|uniref:Archaeal primase DnaG/twinkle, TOPRIM domain n=1 Tax=uncultured Caudovirales phage TaxID=2100421 RepID=A0A6J5MD60_9CAUD|nr:Archaeal primase DnaG/twinkle, TOPRIM domain [uncultured Caudovirales phage]